MKKQLLFLSTLLVFLGSIAPVLGVTSARYKALWNKQVAQYRASKVVDDSQNFDSESVQNTEEERAVTPAVQKELAQEQASDDNKEKSFFEKYASKLAATLVGAAIVGAYELFAENNPGTVPVIGLKDMFGSLLNSVLSLFGLNTDVDDIAAEKVVTTDIPVNVPNIIPTINIPSTKTQQPVLIGTPRPVIIQPTRESVIKPIAEESTTTAISTRGNTPVIIEPVEQPKVVVDKSIPHVTSEDESFKSLSFSDDEDIQIKQPTVIITPDDKGGSLVSGEDDSVYYSMSRSEDENDEVEKQVVVNEPEVKATPVVVVENKEEIKPVVAQQPESKNGNVQAVSSALDKLIAYTESTGNWFLNLFDTKNNTPYNQYVDTFGVLVEQMEKDVNKVDVTPNSMLQATKDFASFLIRQLKDTHKTFTGHKTSSSWSITPTGVKAMALGYGLKKHVNDEVKAERNIALQNLRVQFNGYPELDAKITHLQKVMSGFGDEIEQKEQSVLLAGLTHRLKV